MVEQKEEERRIAYKVLNKIERDRLRQHCIKKFNNVFPRYKAVFQSIKSFITRPCPAPVNKNVMKIIMYLNEVGPNTRGIFRINGIHAKQLEITDKLTKGEDINESDYDVHTLSTGMRKYIREKLNGLIPNVVSEGLLQAKRNRDDELMEELLEMFPFTLEDDKRNILVGIMELCRNIDRKSESNLMTMRNLLLIIPPTIFPQEPIRSINDYSMLNEICELIFRLDYENVPIELINK